MAPDGPCGGSKEGGGMTYIEFLVEDEIDTPTLFDLLGVAE